jgi:MFS family permease
MGDIVPARENNSFWNRRVGLSQITMMIASIICGFVIDQLGRECRITYFYVIIVGIVFAFFSLSISANIPDPDITVRTNRQSLWIRFRIIWRNPQFRRLVYFFGTQSFAVCLIGPFIFIFMQRSLNYSMTTIQLLMAASCVVSFFSAFAFGVIGKKYGRKPIVMFCAFAKGLEFIAWAILLPGFGWVWALPAVLIGGFVNMGLATGSFSLITSLGNKKEQGFLIATFFSITGLISFASAFCSGFVYDVLGSIHIFGSYTLSPFNVLAIIVALLYFLSIFFFSSYKEAGAESTVFVVKKLLAKNPFLAVYHAHILSSPLTEKSRIDTLGKAESNLVASELLSDLYNPSSRVRESAVKNIARKGSDADPKLESELIRVLDFPELGIQSATAAALGQMQSEKAIPALVKYLNSKDITLAQTCIKAIANIGGINAIKELCAIITIERCRQLWPYVAEALGELGDFSVSKKIYAAYSGETNHVLKKQMLIALGRTFAKERASVFAGFANEDKAPGAAIEELIKYFSSRYGENHCNVEQLNNHFDKEQFAIILESVFLPWLAANNILNQALNKSNIDTIISSTFNKKGEINHPKLLLNEYNAVVAWTIVNLWTELKYSRRDFNRYVLLTTLIIIKAACKNAD